MNPLDQHLELTLSQAAKRLRMSRGQARRLAEGPALRAKLREGRVYFLAAEVNAYLAR